MGSGINGICRAIIALLAAQSASGQAEIPDYVTCPTCSIAASAPTRLNLESVTGLQFVRQPVAAVGSNGYVWLLVQNERRVLVFDTGGALVRIIGGSAGADSALFRWPSLAVPVADSMLIFDERKRQAILIGPDLAPVRTIDTGTARVMGATIVKWPAVVLVNAQINTPDRFGLPLHAMDMSANSVRVGRSAGLDVGNMSYFDQHLLRFVTGPADEDERVMISDRYRYRLSIWHGDEWEEMFHRRPEWFSGTSNSLVGGVHTAPSPEVAAVSVDSLGNIWTFVHVAAADWQNAWAVWNPDSPQQALPDLAALYRTVVEVIDPAGGRVVTRGSFLDGRILHVTGNAVMVYRLNHINEPIIETFELRVKGGPSNSEVAYRSMFDAYLTRRGK